MPIAKPTLFVYTDWETGLPVAVIEGDLPLREVLRLWGTQELNDRYEIGTEETDTEEHPNPYL